MAEKSFFQRIRSVRARARFTAYGHFVVHFVTISGFWFHYITSWSEDVLNSSAGTVIAFDEMFATILICYSSYILKEATFKYNLASIRIWLEINGIYFLVSIALKDLVYVLRNHQIENKLIIISTFRALWEAYAILIVYLFYKDQKSRSNLEQEVQRPANIPVDNPSFSKRMTVFQMDKTSTSSDPSTPNSYDGL